MRRIVLALLAALLPSLAFGQAGTQFNAGQVYGNSSAARAPGKAETVTAILDRALGSTRGAIIERGASGWGIIGPSATAGLPYLSGGTGADGAYGVLGTVGGGTGLATYAIGDILYASTASVLSRLADVATGNALIAGGVGVAPSWGKITSSHLNITASPCTNQFISAISAAAGGTCTTATLASAQFANQGTTTTVLHGNAAGNPSFGAVSLATDVTGTLQAAQEPAHTGDVTNSAGSLALAYTNVVPASKGGAGTITGALRGNGAGVVTQAACADLSNGTTLCNTAPGSNVTTALALAANAAGGIATTTGSSTSWTPGITTSGTVGTPAYSAQTGAYERVGSTVTVYFNIVLSSWAGAPTGNVSINNLPVAAGGSGFGMCNITGYSGVLSIGWVSGVPSGSTIILEVIPQTGATGFANLTAANAGGTFAIKGGCTYPV